MKLIISNAVGKGGFGKIFLKRCELTNEVFAVKSFLPSSGTNDPFGENDRDREYSFNIEAKFVKLEKNIMKEKKNFTENIVEYFEVLDMEICLVSCSF
jgi:serine/threonine protein kinase